MRDKNVAVTERNTVDIRSRAVRIVAARRKYEQALAAHRLAARRREQDAALAAQIPGLPW